MYNTTISNQYTAAALYDGGWRSSDYEDLMTEYALTAEEAACICAELAKYEG